MISLLGSSTRGWKSVSVSLRQTSPSGRQVKIPDNFLFKSSKHVCVLIRQKVNRVGLVRLHRSRLLNRDSLLIYFFPSVTVFPGCLEGEGTLKCVYRVNLGQRGGWARVVFARPDSRQLRGHGDWPGRFRGKHGPIEAPGITSSLSFSLSSSGSLSFSLSLFLQFSLLLEYYPARRNEHAPATL